MLPQVHIGRFLFTKIKHFCSIRKEARMNLSTCGIIIGTEKCNHRFSRHPGSCLDTIAKVTTGAIALHALPPWLGLSSWAGGEGDASRHE